ncbi:S-layer domain-containing protein [Desulfofundulus kuznetsovii DSM 6115]|uniref:S-layer domain-containing protein n=1 Tax=Desulfofundulus kuznetsovii (strain DSM 6115 / VKM B-1805 / 17) TaxID=760568 RepID=A0AAU8PZK7_DESK7|nr:S-layer domain-containing protein [Desulfofundulus kuznetsovii DSM 6115]
MGKLYASRTFLGNIALVVFLAFLATLTFGVVHPAPAGAVTLTEKPDLSVQVDEQHRAAVLDKNGSWIKDGGTAKLVTSQDKTAVDFTVQVLTDADFNSIMLHILGIGDLDKNGIKDVVYKKIYNTVYNTVYYVYQFVYHWVYQQGLNVASDKDYTLHICSNDTQLASITLDLEAPPPESGGGGGGGGGGGTTTTQTTTTTDTGTLTSADGKATLTVDDKKVESLLADPKVTEVVFAIPADKAAQQGTVAVTADTLAKVFEAGKPAVVKVGDVQLTLPPGAIDLSVFKGQGVTLKISIGKAQAAAHGDAALKMAGDAYEIVIRAEASGADKGGISSLAKPVTLTLPYDPARLAGVPEDYLGIYRLTGGTWEYVGGKVDRAARKVSVERTSLSTYAVMAYDKNFTDMVGHWAQGDVKLMAAKHIAGGVTETTFAPNASVTRAEFAAFLLRAMNVPEQKAAGSRFKDVAAGAWYAGAVETAAAQGLVGGYPDGTFKPNAPITREELAAMITRALAKSGKDTALSEADVQAQLGRFADAGKIGPWARQAVAVAIKEGIVSGRLADQCVPKANATRAEAVVMVKRFLTATGRL